MLHAASLNYEKRQSWHRRRDFRRSVVFVLLLGFTVATWHWHRSLWRTGQTLYWQHRCLTYTQPADQLIWLSDRPEVLKALAKKDPRYVLDYDSPGAEPESAFLPSTEWSNFRSLVQAPTYEHDGRLVGYYMSAPAFPGPFPKWPYDTAIVFMHERTNALREKRLIVILLSLQGSHTVFWQIDAFCYRTDFRAHRISGNWAECISVNWDSAGYPNPALGRLGRAKFFAGQPDLTDNSRFAIRFELDGKRGMIEGQFLAGESVNMKVRGDDGTTSPSWELRSQHPQ